MKKILLSVFILTVLFSCSPKQNAPVDDKTKSCCKPATDSTAKTISTNSIFILNDTFETQNNKPVQLALLQGKPTVLAMIFTHCTYACPRLAHDMISIAEQLGANRDNLNMVMVSFDSERDNPAALKKFADENKLDAEWILLHGSEQAVRTLSVLLNVQFEKDAEGNFSHSNIITVLDKNGVLKFQKEGLNAQHDETVAVIEKLLGEE